MRTCREGQSTTKTKKPKLTNQETGPEPEYHDLQRNGFEGSFGRDEKV